MTICDITLATGRLYRVGDNSPDTGAVITRIEREEGGFRIHAGDDHLHFVHDSAVETAGYTGPVQCFATNLDPHVVRVYAVGRLEPVFRDQLVFSIEGRGTCFLVTLANGATHEVPASHTDPVTIVEG